MVPGYLKTGLQAFLRRPLRSAFMVLGVALGVAVVLAVDIAAESSKKAFYLSGQAANGRASYQIRGSGLGVPEAVYIQLRAGQGLQNVAPVVEGYVIALDFDEQPLRILGIDPFADKPFRSYLAEETVALPGYNRFFLDPSAVIASADFLNLHDLELGDALRIQVNDRELELRLAGVLEAVETEHSSVLDDLLLMDIAAAQELFGREGYLSRIDVIMDETQARELEEHLPANLRIRPANEQTETVAQLSKAFELNLEALSLLALVVGMFLIYNTMMFSVLERRRDFGILRCLGADSGQIIRLVLLQSLLVATLGAVLGVGLGWLMGKGAIRLVSQTINDLYYVVQVTRVSLPLGTLLKGIGLGFFASLVASLHPAYEATRVPPITMLQRSQIEQTAQDWKLRAVWLAFLILGSGTLLLLAVEDVLWVSFGGMFLILLGLAMLVPAVTHWMIQGVQPLLQRVFGSIGKIAAGLILGSVSRTSVAVAALMVALSVAIGVGVMIDSFRGTVVDWLEVTLRADLYISAPSVSGTRPTASLDPALANAMEEVPGVSEVESIRTSLVEGELGEALLVAVDSERVREEAVYRFARGSPEEIWAEVLAGAVIVSEPFALHHQLQLGQETTIQLQTDHSLREFEVVGMYYDYSTDRGTILMSRETYLRFWDDPYISSMAIFADPGQDLSILAQMVRERLRGTGLQVQPNRALREQALEIFERTFLITQALRLLAVLVAFVGVVSTLMALQLERTREFATLQVLGLEDRDAWLLSLIETGSMGSVAGLLALPTGALLALILVYVINQRSFGWTIELLFDPWIFIGALATGVLAAWTAAVYPTLQLIRQSIAVNLRAE